MPGPEGSTPASICMPGGFSRRLCPPGRRVQPPATAGTTEMVWPAVTGVARPSRNRTSSSARKTLTNRRSWPASSKIRSAKPGKAASRAFRASPTVAPSTSTSPAPPVRVRSWVGMRTDTLIGLAPRCSEWAGSCGTGPVEVDDPFEGAVESVEAGVDGDGGADRPGQGLDGLEAVAGDHGDDPLVPSDVALGGQLGQGGDGDAPGGLGEDALGPGEEADGVDDLGVGDGGAGPTGAADGVEGVPTVGRVADGEGLGDGGRPDRADGVGALGEGGGHRGAAGGLGAGDPDGGNLVEQADLAQLGEPLGHLGELAAGPDGDDDVVGGLPAELLVGFERQGLGALGVVGADVDVDERPCRALAGELGAQPVDVVVVAVDRHH